MRPFIVLAICLAVAISTLFAQSAVTLVVISGRDAINVVQGQPVTAAVVEVRDRTDRPVAGALVTFTVSGGRATLEGRLRSVTVTADTNGRATASLIPLASGPVEIRVQARSGSDSASITIQQTNSFAEEPPPASAPRAPAQPVAGSRRRGLSGTALTGIIGGAAAGGIVGARALTGESDPPQTPETLVLTGAFAPLELQRVISRDGFPDCGIPLTLSGSLRIQWVGGFVDSFFGTLEVRETISIKGKCVFGDVTVENLGTTYTTVGTGPIQGTRDNLTFSAATTSATGSLTRSFTGSLRDNVLTGTYSFSSVTVPVNPPIRDALSFTVPVTLR